MLEGSNIYQLFGSLDPVKIHRLDGNANIAVTVTASFNPARKQMRV